VVADLKRAGYDTITTPDPPLALGYGCWKPKPPPPPPVLAPTFANVKKEDITMTKTFFDLKKKRLRNNIILEEYML